MTAAQARAKVAKLRALADPTRGGTPGERAVAQAKADELERRYKLGRVEPARQAPPRRFKARGPGRFVYAEPIPDFEFNYETGQASGNVTVHHYRNRGNWKITVER